MSSDSVTFRVDGLDELNDAFADLEVATSKATLRKATRIAMQPILNQVQAGVNAKWGDETGLLKDSVKLKTKIFTKNGFIDSFADVGIYRIRAMEQIATEHYGRTYIGAPTLAYWHEFGTQAHSVSKSSNRSSSRQSGNNINPGMTAKPVLRPVMDANLDIITTRTGNVLAEEIDKAWRRNNS